MHKHFKSGFTIIEVTLVLAITGMLFVGIIAGSGLNIARQRYNDSVQNFAEFLRTVYSEVSYVQNPRDDIVNPNGYYCSAGHKLISGDPTKDTEEKKPSAIGRTECAIYGKLIVLGKQLEGDKGGQAGNVVHTFDIIGQVFDPGAHSSNDGI